MKSITFQRGEYCWILTNPKAIKCIEMSRSKLNPDLFALWIHIDGYTDSNGSSGPLFMENTEEKHFDLLELTIQFVFQDRELSIDDFRKEYFETAEKSKPTKTFKVLRIDGKQ